MKLKFSELDRELDKLLPYSKRWLMLKGYVSRDGDEYQWTAKGLEWINSLKKRREKEDKPFITATFHLDH